MVDKLLSDIQKFMVNFFAVSARAERDAQAATRELFGVEVRGFSEFIGVNGRQYRYGFVSCDDARTRALARAMFHDNFNEFEEVVGELDGVISWDELRAPELKIHLLAHPEEALALRAYLPAPLHAVNSATRKWVQGVYDNITRLNADWGTEFTEWEQVRYTDTEEQREAVQVMTQDDITDVQHMLVRATALLMKNEDMEEHTKTIMNHIQPHITNLVKLMPHHGHVELIMAALSALTSMWHSQDTADTFYIILLFYLLQSVHKNNFTPLPSDAHVYTPEEVAADRALFLEQYYDTNTRSVQTDWNHILGRPTDDPLNVLVTHFPASTIKSFEEFTSLVNSLVDNLSHTAIH